MNFKDFSIPKKYMITGEYIDKFDFMKRLEYQILNGITLIQIRAKNISNKDFISLSKTALEIRKKYSSVKIILNSKPEIAKLLNADGVHLTSEILMKLKKRPMELDKLVSAACHNVDELKKAADLNVDFVTLSPVLHTNTHPEATPLGWEGFENLAKNYLLPVFALGGMQDKTLEEVLSHGAYGLASISWWKETPV